MDQTYGKSPYGRVFDNYYEAVLKDCHYVFTITTIGKLPRIAFFPLDQGVIEAYAKDVIFFLGPSFSRRMFLECDRMARNLDVSQHELPLLEQIEKEKEFYRAWAPHVIAGNNELWPLYIAGMLKKEYPVDMNLLILKGTEITEELARAALAFLYEDEE